MAPGEARCSVTAHLTGAFRVSSVKAKQAARFQVHNTGRCRWSVAGQRPGSSPPHLQPLSVAAPADGANHMRHGAARQRLLLHAQLRVLRSQGVQGCSVEQGVDVTCKWSLVCGQVQQCGCVWGGWVCDSDALGSCTVCHCTGNKHTQGHTCVCVWMHTVYT